MNENSLRNLRPFNAIDTELHKAISSKGGRRSAEVRRYKRDQLKAERLRAKAESTVFLETVELYKAISKATRLWYTRKK